MVKDNLVYVHHILDSIEHLESFLSEINYDEKIFASKLYWQNAFIRELEIIGEAANQTDNQFIKDHPEVPWIDMIGMRHKLIHDYFEIKLEIVWDVVTIDIPKLKEPLLKILLTE